MSFWDNFDKKHLIAAHRGASSKEAENTMSAFKEAIGKSDFVELDVTFSKDGVAVIIHDDTLQRTSNIKEFSEFNRSNKVIDYTYEELLKLDFGSKQSNAQKIPTLKEVFQLFKKHNFPVNIEIKNMKHTVFDKIAVAKIVKIIEEEKMENLVLLSSFNHEYIKQAYVLAPQIERAILQSKSNPKDLVEYLKALHVKSYNVNYKLVNEDLVKELNSVGIFVNVYTINDEKKKKRLFDLGVKSIFTDKL